MSDARLLVSVKHSPEKSDEEVDSLTRMMTVLRIFFVAALLLFFQGDTSAAPPTEAELFEMRNLDAQIAIQERARKTLSRQIEQYNASARKKAKEARSLLGKLTKLRQEAQLASTRIELLELQSKRLQGSMAELNRDIARTSDSMKSLIEELDDRILDIYKYGSREELNLLLSAENTHEAIAMAYMLDRLSKQDQMIVEELSGKMKDLERAKATLEKNRVQMARQTEELTKQRDHYHSTIARTNALLREAQGQRQKAEAAAREMEAVQREIGQKILFLLQSRGIKKRPDPSPAEGQKKPPQQDYSYLAQGSQLDWPLRGPVIMPFGSRNHPVFRTKVFNSGIDIRAAAGAPVKAAGPGEVLFCGWLRGLGRIVIVNHGSNLSTVYAHLGTTAVNEGDAVRSGTLLGTVGNTGTSNEYSLHFEVRYGGSAKDPLRYLRRI